MSEENGEGTTALVGKSTRRRRRTLTARMPRVGRSPAWRREGDEPDYRFSLANERTFLAWLRTSMAWMAGAIAVKQFVPSLGSDELRYALGLLLALLGLVSSVAAYRRWGATERAMRESRPLPHTGILALLATGMTLVGVVVVLTVTVG